MFQAGRAVSRESNAEIAGAAMQAKLTAWVDFAQDAG